MRFEMWAAKCDDGEYYVFKIVSENGRTWVLPDFDPTNCKLKLTRMTAPNMKVVERMVRMCDLLEV